MAEGKIFGNLWTSPGATLPSGKTMQQGPAAVFPALATMLPYECSKLGLLLPPKSFPHSQ